MHQFTFDNPLPPTRGIHPAFKDRFSGWHLGMGLPETLLGIIGGLHALGKEDRTCADTACAMAYWGTQAHPLTPGMAAWLCQFADSGLNAPAPFIDMCRHLAAVPPLDDSDRESMETWYALVRQDDRSLILRFLMVTLGHPVKGLAWLHHCWQDMIHLGQPEIGKAALDMVAWGPAALLRQRMQAEWALHSLEPARAIEHVEALNPDLWGMWRAYAGAELLLRLGRQGEAKGALAGLWKAIPWHVNLTLKLHDLFQPTPSGTDADTADVAILAYSWNKADLLADTLRSLAESDIGNAQIFTLDNGSTDHTPEVLKEAQQRFGRERFHIETLPVNVGAPAARNWLLALPGVKASRWAAFLDDDIVLPQNWLRHLLGTAGEYPNAGAIGCRITAATPPYGLQSADYNLFPTPPKPTEPGQLPNRVLVFDNCAGSPDTGMFTYERPCLSVSGCCHLINMEAVDKAGGFDLRYTPSQFDDLDRDLRSALGGMPAVYAGGLAIRHIQHSSLAKSQTTRQIGHVMGNKYKLDTKYSDEELVCLGTENKAQLWADLQTKYDFLVDRLKSGA